MRRRDRYLLVLSAIVVAGIAIRAAMPPVLKNYINNKLASLQAYDGSVADVDVALWRGAYRIEGMRIVKRNGGLQTPFFKSERIDFALEWRSLLKGSIVGEGSFERPNLNLVKAGTEQRSQLGKEVNWAERLKDLFPFRFNTVTVHDGTVTFRGPGIRTQDALVARHIEATVSNLTNVEDQDKETFADFKVTANVLESGAARVGGSVNPLASTPSFDVNLAVEKVHLPQVNPWLRQYLKADAASGDFQLYLEVAAADGRFKGYAKPLMQNVELHGPEDKDKPLPKRLWEGTVDFVAKIFENPDKEQVGARVPFSGTLKNPKAGIFAAIVSVLHNAFIGAFAHSLEGNISLRDVKKDLKQYDFETSTGDKETEKTEKGGRERR